MQHDLPLSSINHFAAQEEDNPFKLPPDDQIFAIREKERQRRAEEREKVKHQHVWEKVCLGSKGQVPQHGVPCRFLRTSASRISRTRRVDEAWTGFVFARL